MHIWDLLHAQRNSEQAWTSHNSGGKFVAWVTKSQVTLLLDHIKQHDFSLVSLEDWGLVRSNIEVLVEKFLSPDEFPLADVQEEYQVMRDAFTIAQRFTENLPWPLDDVVDTSQLTPHQKKDIKDTWNTAVRNLSDKSLIVKIHYLQKWHWEACDLLEASEHIGERLEYDSLSQEEKSTVDQLRAYDQGKRWKGCMTYAECWAIHHDHDDHSKTIMEVLREKYGYLL